MSIAPYAGRKETAVYAKDGRTGITIRCKVFIDRVSRIQIFHHAVKIDLDELATLRIRAFDDEENVFSSLVGVKFLWKLEPKSLEPNAIHHLVHVPLKETPLSDCGGFCGDLDTQIDLEDRGFGADLYVVRGTKIGHEVVTAQLVEPQLEHVMDKIILTVAEAMSLDPPSPVFITVGALIYYSLRVIRANTPQVVDLPSPHHRWSASNSTVAQVDSEMGISYALNLGITNIVVEDTRLSGHVQTSCMHVVIPDKLVLYIVPLSTTSTMLEGTKPIPSSAIWYVFPGQEYIIQIRVFSQAPDVKEIYITEINDLKLDSSTIKYWDILSVMDEVSVTYDKQNSRLLKPISQGQGILTASLNYHREINEKPEILRAVQEVIVCSKVKFNFGEEDEASQIIRLPWAPGISQQVELRATGGCGRSLEDYIWLSSNEAVLSVSTSGLLRVNSPGRAVIKVVSVFDSINVDEVVVEVSVPSSMIVLPNFPVEVVIGTQLEAAVTLETSDGDRYFRCDAFNSFVSWKVFPENKIFKVLDTSTGKSFPTMLSHLDGSGLAHGQPCAWTHLYASAAGRAELHATLSTELQQSAHLKDGAVLKTVSSLAAYLPLVIRQADSGNQFGGYWIDLARTHADIHDADPTCLNDMYLAPGSWMDVLLLGGPERWDEKIEHIELTEVTMEQEKSVTGGLLVQQPSSSDGGLYRVFCQTLGEFKLLFSRGNLAGEGHWVPSIAYTQLLVKCSFPSSITLIANEPVNSPGIIEAAVKAGRTPDRIRTAPVVVANGCTIRVAAVGIHSSGRIFANSSSLCLRWDLNGCDELAHWNESLSCESSLKTGWERFLVLHNASGLCTIRATISGFAKVKDSHLYETDYFDVSKENIITDAMQLQLVSTLRIIPSSVLLVFDPEAKVNLSVTGGTCFLDAVVNDTQVVQLTQPPEGVDCSRLMLSARGLGTALVTVWDIGLSPPAAASALVRVADVEWIKIISDEEISLMEGTVKAFDISAGTQDGFVFDYSQYKYMNMQVHIDDGILELVRVDDSSKLGGRIISIPNFSVKATVLGTTTLYVSIRQHGNEILSQMIKVEVYSPLRLNPEYIYLAPGASYTLTVKGGPKYGALVEYASMDGEIAIIQGSSGRVSAISTGNATVRATVFGTGGILICEAYGRIQVGIPSAMMLSSQSDQLCIGCKMPIFPSFQEGNLFSFYEICSNYKWAVEDEKVLAFSTPSPLHSVADENLLPGTTGKTNLCHFDDSDSAFISVLSGRSAGRTKVSVSFCCEFVSSGIKQLVSYNASETLTVVSDPPLALGIPITWVLPPFYTSSDRLPRVSNMHIHSNDGKGTGTITYSVLKSRGKRELRKQDAIVIDGSKIRTRESNELACIQAEDQITGRTEIASCVRIAEVAQLRASTTGSTFHVAYLATDAKMELAINYCDDLGYYFSEAHGVVPLDVETNYPDVVFVQGASDANKTNGGIGNIFLKARNPGRALVMVTMKYKPEKADFILVSVGAQLYPQNPVIHVGHRLNFTVIGDGIHGPRSGQWSSSNGSVLSVNKMSGEAHAHGEGLVKLTFRDSNLKLQTTVSVLKADQMLVDSPAETLTNVPSPAEGYKFPVKFRNDPYGKFEATGKAVEVVYDCRVDPPYVGYAKPWRDHGTGNSYCLFFPYSPKHLLSSLSKSKAAISEQYDRNDGFLYVSVIASLREAPQVEGAAHALFVGGFSIEGAGKLNLTPSLNKSLIRVIGNTDVEIYWNAKDLLLVTPFGTDGFGIGGVREYKVEVLKDQKITDTLTIVLPTTGQQMEVDVNFDPDGEGGSRKPAAESSTFMWGLIITCLVGLIATVLSFMGLLERRSRRTYTPPTVAAGSPIGRRDQSTATPTAATGSVHSSPHTPNSPFVDYVRRTIDETPYYRRTGRRRFDPQYTY
ncbi:uncharacterized protein A4U43_C10F17460 [Asparagus officinalis]|uniref:BIG2 domain-containing protein n=1 Tax=Asparagus officinalis TaxID=4686 RepID=A0A5P1E3J2_ASPOF|nr:nuclear pore complex protein GP210 [Asparagus officinalis]ONK57184.1 uncharacterized protein A4U43_C10F17460 [Asparagus officinalis]